MKLPPFKVTVEAVLQHWHTKGYRIVDLVWLDDAGADWFTADDGSELSGDWNVISWRIKPKDAKPLVVE